MAKTVSPTCMGRPFCQGAAWASRRAGARGADQGQVDLAGGHPDDLPLAVGLAEHADGQAAEAGEPLGAVVVVGRGSRGRPRGDW